MGADLTLLTIWLSIVAYTAGAVVFAFSAGQRDRVVRLAWTMALVALLVHVGLAFHFYHHWSHTAAYLDTARQTHDLFGWNWGGGLYINYALMIGWVADVGWWWATGLHSYRSRPRSLVVAWHAFLFFVIFNATVVFGSPVARWSGLLICLVLAVAWYRGFAWAQLRTKQKT